VNSSGQTDGTIVPFGMRPVGSRDSVTIGGAPGTVAPGFASLIGIGEGAVEGGCVSTGVGVTTVPGV
jgi:hypothetical protein